MHTAQLFEHLVVAGNIPFCHDPESCVVTVWQLMLNGLERR